MNIENLPSDLRLHDDQRVERKRLDQPQSIWLPANTESDKNAKIWHRINVPKDGFVAETGRFSMAPVQVSTHVQDTRGMVSKWISQDPIADLVHLNAPLGSNGAFQTVGVVRNSMKNQLLTWSSQSGTVLTANDVQQHFGLLNEPARLGDAWIIDEWESNEGERRFPENVLRRILDNSGQVHEQMRAATLQDTQGCHILTDTLRNSLEQHARIVYENFPPNADKLLVCVRDLHADAKLFSDYKVTSKVGNLLHWLKHQRTTRDIFLAIKEEVGGMDAMKLFFETFPMQDEAYTRNGMQISSEDIESFGTSCIDNPEFLAMLELALQEENALGATANAPNTFSLPQNVNTAIYDTSDAVIHILSTLRDVDAARVFGDGLVGGVKAISIEEVEGSADFHRKKEHATYDERQGNVCKMIVSHLQPGEVGYMPYGAGHFSSGTVPSDPDIDVTTFESFFQYLPNTKVIVLEDYHYEELARSLDIEIRHRKQIREKRRQSSRRTPPDSIDFSHLDQLWKYHQHV